MKFLADMGVSMTTVQKIRESGYEVIHLREEGLHKLPDADILEKAKQESRIVLTFDLDFGDLLATNHQMLPSVIIFRLQNHKPMAVTLRLLTIIIEHREDLLQGAILIVQDNRYRVRRLPILNQNSTTNGVQRI
jgi:predicted nuclease of predicted toxin-antitoxin system